MNSKVIRLNYDDIAELLLLIDAEIRKRTKSAEDNGIKLNSGDYEFVEDLRYCIHYDINLIMRLNKIKNKLEHDSVK